MRRASALHAEAVARRLGWRRSRLEELRLGAALHDVGKVNVRADVLGKPGQLDEVELAEVRAHPVEGAWLIAGVASLAPALPYVLFHHERWDGAGYPTRRAGLEIPVEGRLLAVADAFDAMTSVASVPRGAGVRGGGGGGRTLLPAHNSTPLSQRRSATRLQPARSSRSTGFRSRSESSTRQRVISALDRSCSDVERGVISAPDISVIDIVSARYFARAGGEE